MLVRFWGTRGSLAKPGPSTLRYGGNTPCVEIRAADGTLLVMDCGTGAHGLGLALVAAGSSARRGHLLISHTHWDHIQGFPFFAPLFTAGHEWDIYAPGGLGQGLEAALAGQMEYTYFPVTLGQLAATVRYHDLVEGAFAAGGVQVRTRYLNHPALALGYRIQAGTAAVVYCSDHEPHVRQPPEAESPAGRYPDGWPAHQEDRRHIEFLGAADLVIHDTQYAAAEYPDRVGWGHTPAEWAVDYALAAGVRRLALFHHDPLRDDAGVDRLVDACRRRVARAGGALEVFAAAEGQAVEVAEGPAGAVVPAPAGAAAEPPEGAGAATILIADDDPDVLGLLVLTLRDDGFRIVTAADGEEALRLARAERPALILLDWQMPRCNGLEVTRRLRADPDPGLREVPVVLITAQVGSEHTAAGFAAGVTDYLAKPFKPALLRARVRAWLLRQAGPGGAGGP